MVEEQTNSEEITDSEKETIIVASKVKNYIKSKGMMTSSEFYGALNEKIYEILDEAIERTSANKRQMLRAHDL